MRSPELARAADQRVPSWLPAAMLAYFALQLGVPLWLKLQPREDTSADFSWDMFSRRTSCAELSAFAKLPNGVVKPLRLGRAFESAELSRLLYRPRLERFARFVCDGLSARHGGEVALFLQTECRYARDGAPARLSEPQRNYCSGR
jgi:hypothetical protein